jgi:hypothetical protein
MRFCRLEADKWRVRCGCVYKRPKARVAYRMMQRLAALSGDQLSNCSVLAKERQTAGWNAVMEYVCRSWQAQLLFSRSCGDAANCRTWFGSRKTENTCYYGQAKSDRLALNSTARLTITEKYSLLREMLAFASFKERYNLPPLHHPTWRGHEGKTLTIIDFKLASRNQKCEGVPTIRKKEKT